MATTIQISEKLRDKLKTLGAKGESYEDIISRLYESAVERQIQEILMSSKDTISIDEAIGKHKSKWQK